MRVRTAGQIKGSTKHPSNDIPSEGTQLRSMYDQLLVHRGKWFVPICYGSRKTADMMDQLLDFYGMDIQRRGPRRTMEYRLRGEYFGRDYVSYLEQESA